MPTAFNDVEINNELRSLLVNKTEIGLPIYQDLIEEDPIAHLNQIIEKEPANAQAHLLRGRVKLDYALGKRDEDLKIKAANQVIQLSTLPHVIEEEYLDSSDYQYAIEQAIADFNKVIEIEPANAKAYWYRAMAYIAHTFSEREWSYISNVNDLKDFIQWHPLENCSSSDQVCFEQVKTNLDALTAIEHKNEDAYFVKGAINRALGFTEQAIADFGKVIDIIESDSLTANFPSSLQLANAYEARSKLYLECDQYEKAKIDAEKTIQLELKKEPEAKKISKQAGEAIAIRNNEIKRIAKTIERANLLYWQNSANFASTLAQEELLKIQNLVIKQTFEISKNFFEQFWHYQIIKSKGARSIKYNKLNQFLQTIPNTPPLIINPDEIEGKLLPFDRIHAPPVTSTIKKLIYACGRQLQNVWLVSKQFAQALNLQPGNSNETPSEASNQASKDISNEISDTTNQNSTTKHLPLVALQKSLIEYMFGMDAMEYTSISNQAQSPRLQISLLISALAAKAASPPAPRPNVDKAKAKEEANHPRCSSISPFNGRTALFPQASFKQEAAPTLR